MAARITDALKNFSEHFRSAWLLLSDTTIYLSRTPEFYRYEKALRDWRSRLQENRNNTEVAREVRAEIVALRKGLRAQGWDVSLGSMDVQTVGFRSDDSVRYGFGRLVLYISDERIFYVKGQDNHVELDSYLSSQIRAAGLTSTIRQRHFLWYRWLNRVIELAGADTESKDAYEQLVDYVEANKLFVLNQLKKLP